MIASVLFLCGGGCRVKSRCPSAAGIFCDRVTCGQKMAEINLIYNLSVVKVVRLVNQATNTNFNDLKIIKKNNKKTHKK